MNPLAEDRAEPIWFIKAQGRVWGPYPESRLEGFAAEGRVAATTLVATTPDGSFSAAGLVSALRRLFAPPVAPESYMVLEREGESHTPSPHGYAESQESLHQQLAIPTPQRAAEPVVVEHAGLMRPLLVFAALASLEEPAFEAALAIQGPYERIAAGLWLVKARLGAAALRNALSRRLRGGDTLMVVEASLESAAWFNLDLAEERRLRTLWAG